VYSCDYSHEANLRAKEIYDVDGETVDVLKLPFQDDQFDVVICSETLEHIPDIRTATLELIRVARKAVIITVPCDPPERIERNLRNTTDPFPHCQALNRHSFDWAETHNVHVIPRGFSSHLLSLPFRLAGAENRYKPKYSKVRLFLYNTVFMGLCRVLFGKRTVASLIRLDNWISSMGVGCKGLLFILVKDPSIFR